MISSIDKKEVTCKAACVMLCMCTDVGQCYQVMRVVDSGPFINCSF